MIKIIVIGNETRDYFTLKIKSIFKNMIYRNVKKAQELNLIFGSKIKNNFIKQEWKHKVLFLRIKNQKHAFISLQVVLGIKVP